MLNAEQQAAVDSREGAWCGLAGPGAGKTTVLVARHKALLDAGFRPEDILSLTYTKEAAKEMTKRAGFSSDLKVFRTFHSFCLALIIREAAQLPFTISANPLPTPGQQRKLLGMLTRKYGCDFRGLASYISEKKRANVSPEQAIGMSDGDESYALAYQEYEGKCRKEGWLDFDSIMMESVRLLEQNADVRDRNQFRWIQVDEAQDTDDIQRRLVQLISEKHGNVFFIGDPSQSLYEWRGAAPTNMLDFPEHFPGGQFLYLGRNYRSTRSIVDFCKEIAPIKGGLTDRLCTENEQGAPPSFIQYGSDLEEADKTLAAIRIPERSAILARTNRQLASFENMCIEGGIRYKLLGKSGFWQQDEVRNLVAFADFLKFPADSAFTRILRTPYPFTRFIQKQELLTALVNERESRGDGSLLYYLLDKIFLHREQQREAVSRFQHTLRALQAECRGVSVENAMNTVVNRTDILNYYGDEEESDAVDNSAVDNVNEVVRIARRFSTLEDFTRHAHRAIGASRNRKGLTLSTIHQAKGKEWDSVNVVGVSDGLLPHKNGTPEEEARIFFVACSRAAKRLQISFVGKASPFIAPYLENQNLEERGTPDAQQDFLGQFSFGLAQTY